MTGLDNNAEYSFKVHAVNGAGDGVESDWVDATPTSGPGVLISRPSLTVDEGSSGTYTVKLNTAPTADVTVTVGGISGEVSVTGSPLNFTTGNRSRARTVTVSAGEDDAAANDSATLTHRAASSDNNYGSSLTIQSVAVTVNDNDTNPGSGSGSGGGTGGGEAPSVPAAPTGLRASAGNAQVTLSWSGPTDLTISKWQVQ